MYPSYGEEERGGGREGRREGGREGGREGERNVELGRGKYKRNGREGKERIDPLYLIQQFPSFTIR